MPWTLLFWICVRPCAQTPSQNPDDPAKAQATARLHALLEAARQAPLSCTELPVKAPSEGWGLGMISSVAVDRKGTIYVLQRGEKADPVVVMDRDGHVLRSWGKGLYKIPHSIRIDSAGNVWTVDAESSVVLKFTPNGRKLMEIDVGEQPTGRRSRFVGTTDIAFGPHGRLFISDGYGNARILEYTPDGKRVHEWGTAGSGPGQFRLPHGITIDKDNVIYVADRENGRIQRFDLDGRFLGEWALGRTYAVQVTGGAVWAAMQPINLPVPSPGWMVKLDRRTGRVLESVESNGLHSITVAKHDELLTGVTSQNQVLWFRAKR
jgi:DNA-binding beta-propeller fold protein YncE